MKRENINGDEEEEEEYEEEDDDDATLSKPQTREDAIAHRIRAESLFRRMRVHHVIVKGNEKTKDHVIEAEVDVVDTRLGSKDDSNSKRCGSHTKRYSSGWFQGE